MGHLLIGTLPETLPWRKVVHLIGSGADIRAIAAATSQAAEESLIAAGRDPIPKHVFYLLTQIPLAARSESFPTRLRKLGIFIDGPITLAALCSEFIEAVDRLAVSAGDRTDFGELATLSAVETLSAIVGNEQVDFFARLTRRHLDYYLSRELPKHVGVTERFRSVREHLAFEEALDRYCREVAEIARQYSSQWFSKHVYEGGIDPAIAGAGIHYAFKKVRDELRVRRERHA
jgi:hypothetical protein